MDGIWPSVSEAKPVRGAGERYPTHLADAGHQAAKLNY